MKKLKLFYIAIKGEKFKGEHMNLCTPKFICSPFT